MDKNFRDHLIVMSGFILTIVLLVAILTLGYEERVIGETPCVDGLNRVNLEGIMCEKTEGTFFGLNYFFGFLVFIIPITYLIIMIRIN